MDRPAMSGARLVSGTELENLPSFGMSTYINLESGIETASMLKQISDGKYRTQKEHSGGQTKPNVPSSSPRPGTSRMPPPAIASSSDKPIQVYIQESQGKDSTNYGFKFAAATAPISSTVDASQIMETEMNSEQGLCEGTRPELHVKLITDYMRFRYMSEKCPKKKGAKPRHYEMDDNDKHCLAEVKIKNYNGAAKIIAYCVDQTGMLHPYNLFGEFCHSGVYVCRHKFRPGKAPLKLQKVSVTTPRAKEYKENLKNQLAILSEAGINDIKFTDVVEDKQIVYVMFKAILDDCDGEIISQISTPLQNKKKGKEFRIDDVEPVSAPASGDTNYNVNRNRVMLHVTENTAFPSEVGVKIRERDADKRIIWETEPDNIFTIKQCVVKFIPPPYKNPWTTVDVEVEICLYDKKTMKETEPFKFVYRGSELKTKKRKLDEDITMPASFQSEKFVKENRKFLSAMRTRPASSSSRSSSEGSSPENSLSYMQELESAGPEDRAVSLLEQRATNGQLPFTSYAGNEGQDQNLGHSDLGLNSSQTVQHASRPQSAGFSGEMSGASQIASANQSSIVTSTTSVFGATSQMATYQTAPTTMPVESINSITSIMSHQPQQQPKPAQRQDSQFMVLSDEDKLNFAQQGVQFPKLGPNQMLALIGGKIYVVYDDTAEQTSNVTPPPATYNPQAVVQNIGQQQVFIQHVAPQQPASESDQRQLGLQTNVAQGSFQTQTTSNISLTMENPQYSTTSNATINVPASQSTAAHQHLLQQQQLQQQQQQQQQQQLAFQQLAQVAAAAGLDINQPGVYQQLIQQVFGLQTQLLQQEDQTANANSGMFGSGSDLNDDDVEVDGDQTSKDNENNDTINGQMSQSDGIGDHRNKKLRASSNKERDRFLQNNIVIQIVPGVEVDDSASNIPTFVHEVVIGDESNDSDSYSKVPSEKNVDYVLKNGSFGNDIGSEDEDGL